MAGAAVLPALRTTLLVLAGTGGFGASLLYYLTPANSFRCHRGEPVVPSNFLMGAVSAAHSLALRRADELSKRSPNSNSRCQAEPVNRIQRDRVLNALTVIRGRVEIAESRDGVSTADSLSVIDDRSAGVQQVVELTITHGGADLSLDAVPVVPCVESGVDAVRETHPSADYDLRADVPPDLQVRANSMLDNLVAHLVENAVVS